MMHARPDRAVQRETTRKWLREMAANHREYLRTGDAEKLLLARNYADEALEHASMMRDGGKSVKRTEKVIDRVLGRAGGSHRLPRHPKRKWRGFAKLRHR